MKRQLVTTLINHKTKQFFVTFNNEDCPTVGWQRIRGNYLWVQKRTKEIKEGKHTLEKTPSILHAFDNGIYWALKNSRLDDWKVHTDAETILFEDVKDIEKHHAEQLEKQGFVNVRVMKAKGPAARLLGSYNWGSWNPNKTLEQYKKLMANISKFINKEIPMRVIVLAWSEGIKENGRIKNKNDLCEFLIEQEILPRD